MTDPLFAGLRIQVDPPDDPDTELIGPVRGWALAMPRTTMTYSNDGSAEESTLLALLGAFSALSTQAATAAPLIIGTWTDTGMSTFDVLNARVMSFIGDDDLPEVIAAWPWRLARSFDRAVDERPRTIVDFPNYTNVYHLDVGYGMASWCAENQTPWSLEAVLHEWGMSYPVRGWDGNAGHGYWQYGVECSAEAEAIRMLAEVVCTWDDMASVDPRRP